MPDLHALLASSIVCALEEREHVIVAPGCADALCAALEPVVAQGMPALLSPLRGSDEPSPPALLETRRATLQRALDDTAKRVAALLLATDHVDDIFVDEPAIRRDVVRAMRSLLRDVQRGDVDADGLPESGVPERATLPPPSDGAPPSSGSWRPPAPEIGANRGSWRPLARRSDPSGLRDEEARAAGVDGPLGYFLDNLERSLSVLEEFGEGPPSAPAALGTHSEPPPSDETWAAQPSGSSKRSASRGPDAAPRKPPKRRPIARTATARPREPRTTTRAKAPPGSGSSNRSRRKARTAGAPAQAAPASADASKRTSGPSSAQPPRRRAAAGGSRAKR